MCVCVCVCCTVIIYACAIFKFPCLCVGVFSAHTSVCTPNALKGGAIIHVLCRYNNFQHDPLSACNCTPPYSAENAISARSDLNPANGVYPFSALGHRSHGGVDSKVRGIPHLCILGVGGMGRRKNSVLCKQSSYGTAMWT